jgi:hypothetical protein
MPSFFESFSALFKMYYALNFKYPQDAKLPWTFCQQVLFGIRTAADVSPSDLKEFITDITVSIKESHVSSFDENFDFATYSVFDDGSWKALIFEPPCHTAKKSTKIQKIRKNVKTSKKAKAKTRKQCPKEPRLPKKKTSLSEKFSSGVDYMDVFSNFLEDTCFEKNLTLIFKQKDKLESPRVNKHKS